MADELSGPNEVEAIADLNSARPVVVPDKDEAERNLAEAVRKMTNPNAAQAASVQDKSTPAPEAVPQAPKPKAENKDDVPQQFRTKDGDLDAAKVEQSKQHLEKLVQDKKAILESYKAQQTELRKLNSEIAAAKTSFDVPKASDQEPASTPNRFSDEFKKSFRARLESDPEGALADFAAAIVKAEIEPIKQDLRGNAVVSRIQELANNGNDWLLTKDGVDKVNGLFQEHPELLHGKDPYGLAVRLLGGNSNGMASGQAQPGPKTPILSSGGAVPPIPGSNAGSGSNDLKATGQELLRNLNDPVKSVQLQALLEKQAREFVAKYR